MFDRQKTKIIATLGDPDRETYSSGIYEYDDNWIKKPNLRQVLDLFFSHGVDIVRLNLAHIGEDEVAEKFLTIKETVLSLELKYKRRLGFLADLPGPKIRFKSPNWLIPTKKLYVSLYDIQEKLVEAEGEGRPEESTACVCLGEMPFADADPDVAKGMLEEIKRRTASGERPLAFIGDNDCLLKVQTVENGLIVCKVISTRDDEGLVANRKGFTVRGVRTPIPGFTKEDKTKLGALLAADYEKVGPNPHSKLLTHIGISFCQNREDVRDVLEFIDSFLLAERDVIREQLVLRLPEFPLLIAKIETIDGVDNIEGILDLADGVMIARGDLALQLPTTDIPEKSKMIAMQARIRGKSSIMATQMLDSMKNSMECSRPEAADVFNAVLDGVDALMLSGETSSGKFPAHAIRKMREIAWKAEILSDEKVAEKTSIIDYYENLQRFKAHHESTKNRWQVIYQEYSAKIVATDLEGLSVEEREERHQERQFMSELSTIKNLRFQAQGSTDDVTHAACVMASDEEVRAILTPTASGRTARMLSRFKPHAWIVAQPHDEFVARKMTIIWGVEIGDIFDVPGSVAELMRLSYESLLQTEELKDATVIFTCGTPMGRVGSTNLVQKWISSVPPV